MSEVSTEVSTMNKSIPETVRDSTPPSSDIPEGAVKIQDLEGTDKDCLEITLPGGVFKHVIWAPPVESECPFFFRGACASWSQGKGKSRK